MDKKLAKKWVKALRSGKYKQTTDNLQDETGHCCLGVLCEIQTEKKVMRDSYGILEGLGLDDQGLKHLTGESLGIRNICLSALNDSGRNISLSALNDSDKVQNLNGESYEELSPFNFDEIADIIQAVEILGVLDKEKVA